MKLNLSNNQSGSTVDSNKTDSNKTSFRISQEKMRKRMIIVVVGILGAVIFVLFLLFIFSLLFHKKPTYHEIEQIMKNAAIEYYSNHRGRLPQNNETVEAVDDDILVRNEYMKPLSKYLKDGVNCIGKVEVDYNNGSYIYTPYLECGKAYSTEELYKTATAQKNLVTSGYGLYNINNEFVYRGEEVSNYITLDGNTSPESLWRIVKFTNEKEAVLIKDAVISTNWDNRFNVDKGYRAGVNDYSISRIKDELGELYSNNNEKEAVLTKKAREKLVVFDLCIGKRAQDNVSNDNSTECLQRAEKQRIGLLTISDYLNASTDSNCNSIYSKSCQNYNYLKISRNWWLSTALTENSYSVYYVNDVGYIDSSNASSMFYIRPVVRLSSKAMYSGGNGTLNNPYKIR